jgi:hypothetical protein
LHQGSDGLIEVLKDCSDHVTISGLQVLASKEECLDDNFIDRTFWVQLRMSQTIAKLFASPNKLTTGLPTRSFSFDDPKKAAPPSQSSRVEG